MPQLLEKETTVAVTYNPDKKEKDVLDHLKKRIPVLKDTKKKILNSIDYEQIMKDADVEYMPRNLKEKQEGGKNVMLIQDEIKGKRGSRIVPITGQEGSEWRSSVSEPTLLIKIQTAISILVDQNPEAVFKATEDKFKPISVIAKAIWKRSWNVAQSKEQLKLFIFDLAKYGWAIGRTYPRLVQREGEILTELDINNPDNNKYKKVKITEFNDIYREVLDPYRTWIDDMTNLKDPFSCDDWYFEKDFSKDTFEREFGMYANAKYVKFGTKGTGNETDNVEGNDETKQRTDLITLGFYESKNKDSYVIYDEKDGVIVYYSPLPNDEKKLSNWWAYWIERDPRTPYGIGLYEIIKNNKVLYDRLENMTMDQLVLSIYSMLFYTGTNQAVGDGNNTISPGLMKQKLPGTTIEQVKIDFDPTSFEGIKFMGERMDDNTGITPTLQGEVEGKTLGEVLHAKDSALKRLNIPLSNIASGFIEKDAYLTLSWANQVYSLPEVMEFASQKELDDFKAESEKEPENVMMGEDGTITADFPRTLDLSLDQDREGTLIESPEDRFFTVGKDLPRKSIKWEGQITVSPQSIIAPSQELDRQRKMELFNMVFPATQMITQMMAMQDFQSAVDLAKPVVQILEIQNEEPKDWLGDKVVLMLDDPAMVAQMTQQAQIGQQMAMDQANASQELFVDPNSPEAQPIEPGAEMPQPGPGMMPTSPMSQAPGINKVVPGGQLSNQVKNVNAQIGAIR